MASVDTLYGPIAASLLDKMKAIRLLVCDVDGVFSDGRIYLGNDGEELKAFHTRDGYGIKALQNCGIQVAVITGRQSNIVQTRMQSLGVAHILQGQEQKQQALSQLASKLGFKPEQIAAIGDDMPDLGMYAVAAVSIAVQDAHPAVLHQADFVTRMRGGFGAVREVCDLLLQANDALTQVHGASV